MKENTIKRKLAAIEFQMNHFFEQCNLTTWGIEKNYTPTFNSNIKLLTDNGFCAIIISITPEGNCAYAHLNLDDSFSKFDGEIYINLKWCFEHCLHHAF